MRASLLFPPSSLLPPPSSLPPPSILPPPSYRPSLLILLLLLLLCSFSRSKDVPTYSKRWSSLCYRHYPQSQLQPTADFNACYVSYETINSALAVGTTRQLSSYRRPSLRPHNYSLTHSALLIPARWRDQTPRATRTARRGQASTTLTTTRRLRRRGRRLRSARRARVEMYGVVGLVGSASATRRARRLGRRRVNRRWRRA